MAGRKSVKARVESYYASRKSHGLPFVEAAWFKAPIKPLKWGVARWPNAQSSRSVSGAPVPKEVEENTMLHTHCFKPHIHQRDVEVWMKKYFRHTNGRISNCAVAVMFRNPRTGRQEVGGCTIVRIPSGKIRPLLRHLKGQASSVRIYNLGMAIKHATTWPARQTYRNYRKFFVAKVIAMPGFEKKMVGGRLKIVRQRPARMK